jgi:hypothetical protein
MHYLFKVDYKNSQSKLKFILKEVITKYLNCHFLLIILQDKFTQGDNALSFKAITFCCQAEPVYPEPAEEKAFLDTFAIISKYFKLLLFNSRLWYCLL